ncbi:MAG: hypothetical protein GEU99_13375 [Luteitalea sp.]|nr:hypothetical protein [Luteitalea sp.]
MILMHAFYWIVARTRTSERPWKDLPFAKDKSTREYLDVTPLGWGRRFHDQTYVSQAAMRVIAERGGHE